MIDEQDASFPEIRESVRRLCAAFPGAYWQRLGVATHVLKMRKSF